MNKKILKIRVFILPSILIFLFSTTKCQIDFLCASPFTLFNILFFNFFCFIVVLITFVIFKKLFVRIFKRKLNFLFELIFVLSWISFLLISYSSILPATAALITKNIDFCQFQNGEVISRKDCIYSLAKIIGQNAKDIKTCDDKISDIYEKTVLKTCQSKVIQKDGVKDAGQCLEVETPNLKAFCLSKVASKKGDSTVCEQAGEVGIVSECYAHIIMQAHDEALDEKLCEKACLGDLTDFNFKSPQACYYLIARRKKDPSLCEKTGSFKQRCYEWFEKHPAK